MNAILAVVLMVMPQSLEGNSLLRIPNTPASYPWNIRWQGWFQEQVQQLDSVFLGRSVKREPIALDFTYKAPGYGAPMLWLDTFERLTDDGNASGSARVRVITYELARQSKAPIAGATYVVAVTKPIRGDARLFRHSVSDPIFRVRGSNSGSEVGGLACIPAARVLRAKDASGKEDLLGTMLLTLTTSLGGLQTAGQIKGTVDRILDMNLVPFVREEHHGGPEFTFSIAGMRSRQWIESRITPLLKEALTKLKGDEMRADVLALLTRMPGGESHGREMFELLKRLAGQKKWGLVPDNCNISIVPSKERMQAAHQFPGAPREFFFPFPDVGGIEAKKRPPPPDDATIRMIISWLPSARPTFAIQLLRLLSSWADRSQMSPDLKLNPKVSTGPWKNGEPVVENLEFLIKLWRENPPPIRRSGS